MRIVFMGSPEFARPVLQQLIESEHEIVAVYTQPDRPSGRGRRPAPPPVKALANTHGLLIRQPKSISRPDAVDELRRLAPDIGVIAAYGQILRQPVLDVPPLGILNVHASLLPRWRGAAPIPAAILAGDAETGATIMLVRLALDAGPVLGAARVGILPSDTTATLTPRIAAAGASLLIELLPQWQRGEIAPAEQDGEHATYASRIEKADARIDWTRQDAVQVWRSVRAYNPWPVAFTHLDGQILRIAECLPLDAAPASGPGTIFAVAGGFAVTARGHSAIAVTTVQAPGGRPMAASDYLRGHAGIVGKRFT